MRLFAAFALALAVAVPGFARAAEPYGIGLEGFPYPHPVSMLALSEDEDALRASAGRPTPRDARPGARIRNQLPGLQGEKSCPARCRDYGWRQ